MKHIFTISFLIIAFLGFSQENDLNLKLENLNSKVNRENQKLKTEILNLNSQIKRDSLLLSNLSHSVENLSASLNLQTDSLGNIINSVDSKSNTKYGELTNSTKSNFLITIVIIACIVISLLIVYIIINKRLNKNKSDMISQLSENKKAVEEKLVSEFSKSADFIEKQIQLLEKMGSSPLTNSKDEIDHSLALKLADEITLIERNIRLMDSTTKGLKQLNRSVSNLKDNLLANGYELPELFGRDYNPGMKVTIIATNIDENLAPDKEVIGKIIKPQVNFKEKMIQMAQVEILKG